jgi:DNA polymerase III subunit chi
MTRIDFYSGVSDKLQTVCRLSHKAVQQGLRVMIYVPPDQGMTEQLDKLLWTFSATGFLPHCSADHKLAEVTPVIFGHQSDRLPHDEVLLNLQDEYPPFFSRFQRLIELSGTSAEDMAAARRRYRFYHDRGYDIRHHKLGDR